MGAWGTAISSNDEYRDFYDDIIDNFNKGTPIKSILDETVKKYENEYIDDEYSLHNLYFASVYAGWECGYLDKKLYERVKEIIESGRDIECWKELGASQSDLRKREKALYSFLAKLSTPKGNPKKPKPIRYKSGLFKKGDVLSVRLDDGSYTGAVVIENIISQFGNNFIVKAYIRKSQKPTLDEILNAKVLDYVWYSTYYYKKYISQIEVIGNVDVKHNYCEHGVGTKSAGWGTFVLPIDEKNKWIQDNIEENRDIKNISAFLDMSPNEISERQEESVSREIRNSLEM